MIRFTKGLTGTLWHKQIATIRYSRQMLEERDKDHEGIEKEKQLLLKKQH